MNELAERADITWVEKRHLRENGVITLADLEETYEWAVKYPPGCPLCKRIALKVGIDREIEEVWTEK